MEIKTSKEIMHNCQDCTVDLSEKWVTVDDVINYLDNESFGYKDLGCNAINGDELRKELNSQSNENKKEAD